MKNHRPVSTTSPDQQRRSFRRAGSDPFTHSSPAQSYLTPARPAQRSLAEETLGYLRAARLFPKKALGQNFLIDRDALQSAVDAADLQPDDVVLEVGPGVGVLTNELVERVAHVIAVELDHGLADLLRRRFAGHPRVTILEENILHLDLRPLLPEDQAFKVVANIPYYLTAPLLRLFLEGERRPVVLVLMVQREVAQRLTAKPGDLSLLGISAQLYSEPELVRHVPSASFHPAPEVNSAIVRLTMRAEPAVPLWNPTLFFRVVKAGFGDKRKQIHNALKQNLGIPPLEIDAALQSTQIDRARRAETLSLEEWSRLTAALLEPAHAARILPASAFQK